MPTDAVLFDVAGTLAVPEDRDAWLAGATAALDLVVDEPAVLAAELERVGGARGPRPAPGRRGARAPGRCPSRCGRPTRRATAARTRIAPGTSACSRARRCRTRAWP